MPKGIYKRTEFHKQFGFKKGNQLGKATAGSSHGNWNGGFKYYKGGTTTYRWIRVGIKKYYAEHRYVMEEYLGRKLTPKEAVHHIDGNGLNNSLDNLKIVSWAEHKDIHRGSYKYENFVCKCGYTIHFAKEMCERCYMREYMRKRCGYKRRFV